MENFYAFSLSFSRYSNPSRLPFSNVLVDRWHEKYYTRNFEIASLFSKIIKKRENYIWKNSAVMRDGSEICSKYSDLMIQKSRNSLTQTSRFHPYVIDLAALELQFNWDTSALWFTTRWDLKWSNGQGDGYVCTSQTK